MKYILKKDLPLAKAGTEVVLDNFMNLISLKWTPLCSISEENITEWLEEIKETPKTIYDLKEWRYFYLNESLEIENQKVYSWVWSDNAQIRCFLTEREAKRNKLLRELATRTDKFLPEEGDTWIDLLWNTCSWYFNHFEYLDIHIGIVFKDQEEYNKYINDEAKNLLFKP